MVSTVWMLQVGQSPTSGCGVCPPVPSTPIKERHYNKTTESGDVFDVAAMGSETGKRSRCSGALSWDLGSERGPQDALAALGEGVVLAVGRLALLWFVS